MSCPIHVISSMNCQLMCAHVKAPDSCVFLISHKAFLYNKTHPIQQISTYFFIVSNHPPHIVPPNQINLVQPNILPPLSFSLFSSKIHISIPILYTILVSFDSFFLYTLSPPLTPFPSHSQTGYSYTTPSFYITFKQCCLSK